ncbi:TerB family tellurite resistance protein [Streptomyces uncialis]|uniref:TerB family tellurite resistance protein n=1 Tax=Streptomyces uncialis TaxID=1048205 RepID=UPI002E3104A0|nr:TerB family tellurite resistance protein [Streptomyces uncialis]
MLPSRGRYGRAVRGARRSRLMGVRTVWTTVSDGEFYCPGCGGDRNYQRRTGRRRFTVLGLPLVPRGAAAPVVECVSCQERFGTDALDHPTSQRFSAMLRDAVHTVALAVLAAGGTGARTAVDAALAVVRDAGYRDCDGEQLVTLVEALCAEPGRLPGFFAGSGAGASGLTVELREALEPLAPHLAPAGREALLLQGARIALADGAYTPAERDTLTTVGCALTLTTEDVTRLLKSARPTPS